MLHIAKVPGVQKQAFFKLLLPLFRNNFLYEFHVLVEFSFKEWWTFDEIDRWNNCCNSSDKSFMPFFSDAFFNDGSS